MHQEVITDLDAHLYGPLPDDHPGLGTYWESVYHTEDTLTKSSNARYTVYQSFLRTSARLLREEQEKRGEGNGECIPEKNMLCFFHQ